MNAAALRTDLCRHFCASVEVHEVPAGLAVSLPAEDAVGDRIGAYVVLDQGAPYLADAGTFLADLDASGLDVLKGQRREFLDRTLRPAGAFVDEQTLEIRTPPLDAPPGPNEVIGFLSALASARGIEFWTREVVRSTFVEDAVAALRGRLGMVASVETAAPPSPALAEFPADVLLRPHDGGMPTAVFLAQSVDRLTEALLLWQEARMRMPGQLRVAALLEDARSISFTSPRVLRVVNRIDGFAFYREDETAAIERIGSIADLRIAA